MTLHLFPLLTLFAVANALLPAALTSIEQYTFMNALLSGFGQSFVIWFSLVVSAVLWNRSTIKSFAHSRITYIFALLLSLALLIPLATINWLICAACAAIWLTQYRDDPYARASALLILAIAIREPTTKLCLTLFANQILSFDTWLTFLSLSFFNETSFSMQDNLITQPDGYGLLILTGCSSFINLSLVLLFWLALSLRLKPSLSRIDIALASMLGVCVVALNTFRLTLMAIDQYWYQLFHDGNGALIIELSTFLLAFLPVLWRKYYEYKACNPNNFSSGTPISAFNKINETSIKSTKHDEL